MKKLLLILSIFLIGIVFAQESQEIQIPKIYGRDVFINYKCVACHSHNGQQIISKKPNAISLDKMMIADTALLKKYLLKQTVWDDVKLPNHPIKFKGSQEELDTLSNWLIENKEIENEK